MIYHNSLSDSIVNRYVNILGSVTDDNLNTSLVGFLSQYGKLYYGNLKKSLFETQYRVNKNRNLNSLLNYQSLTSSDRRQPIKFILHMLRLAQSESWNLPGLITETDDQLYWACGNSRLFASGMCHPTPWETVNFLILQKHQTPEDYYLVNPTPVLNDIDLHKVLNISTDPTELPLAQLALMVLPENDHARVVLSLISDRTPDTHAAGQCYIDNFVEWQAVNPKVPKLKIYTNWPEKIINTDTLWDTEIAGPSIVVKEKLLGYGQLEFLLSDKNNKPDDCYSLFVLSNRKIDLSDFFFWVDNKHSAFIEQNLDFVLFKPQPQYLVTRINVSCDV